MNCKLLLNNNARLLLNSTGRSLLNDDSCYPEGGKPFRTGRQPVRLRTQQILQRTEAPLFLKSNLYMVKIQHTRVNSTLLARYESPLKIKSNLKQKLYSVFGFRSNLSVKTNTDTSISGSLKLPLKIDLIIQGIKDYTKIDRLLTILGLME